MKKELDELRKQLSDLEREHLSAVAEKKLLVATKKKLVARCKELGCKPSNIKAKLIECAKSVETNTEKLRRLLEEMEEKQR